MSDINTMANTADAADAEKPPCAVCPAPGHLLCGQCKSIRFCSQECQQTAQYQHSRLCKDFLKYQTPPAEDVVRILFFPADSEKPEFRWLAKNLRREGEHASLKEPLDGHVDFKKDVDNCNRYNGRTHPHNLALVYDDDFMNNYPDYNKAVALSTGGMLKFLRGGPIVVYRGSTGCYGAVGDVDMMDFHHLTAWLIDYYNDTEENKKRRGPKVHGVLVRCKGEQKLTGSVGKPVTISRLHPLFHCGTVSSVSKLIGIPLIAVPAPKHRKEWDVSEGDYFNSSVFAQVGVGPSADHDYETSEEGDFCWAPKRWQTPHRGNIWWARVDRKPLDADLIETFLDFCQFHITQYFQWEGENRDEDEKLEHRRKRRVLDEMTKRQWQVYFEDWKKYKKDGIRDDVSVNTRIHGAVSMAFDEESGDRLCDHLLRNHH